MIANLVENRSFFQAAPGGDEPDGSDAVLIGLFRGVHKWGKIDQAVAWRFRLVCGGLGAEFAILGATAGFDVHDGTEMNFVAFEMFADAVSPGKEGVDVAAGFEVEEPLALVAVELVAGDDFGGEFTDAMRGGHGFVGGVCVNHFGAHG